MAVKEIWFLSFFVYGLLLNVSKSQKAKYGTSIWNRNQHKQRTSEPRLGAFDRVNTTDVPEEFEPVTNIRGLIINKPVPGQEMYNNVINTGKIVTNKNGINKVQTQPPRETTPEPVLGKFDRINTTDVPEEFEPITNNKGLVINKPVHGQEMYNDVMIPGYISNSRAVGIQNSLNKTLSQHRTTAEPRLGTFDRINTTDVPEEFEPVTNWKGMVLNKPVPGQEMHNDAFRSAYGQVDMVIKAGATKLQTAEGKSKKLNQAGKIVLTSTMKASGSKGKIKAYSVKSKSRQKSLKRQKLEEKEVEHEETEKEEPQEEEKVEKPKKKPKIL